jgi:hypothetical protein
MAKLFTLQDFKVIIEPQALLISPFSDIWNNDKSKDKSVAYEIITFIWFYADYESPYKDYKESERSKLIKEQVIKNLKFKEDDLLKRAIQAYKDFDTSASLQMLESAEGVVHKMKDYFDSVDFTKTQTSKSGIEEAVFDIDKISKAITNMPKLIESLNQAKEICKKERTNSNRVRGGASVGLYEE